MSKCREQRKGAPEHRAKTDDELAGVAICQRSDKWRGNHVKAEKRAGQISDLSFAEVELILHQRLYREQHVAIHIIEQVERGQNGQRGASVELRLRHGRANIAREQFE